MNGIKMQQKVITMPVFKNREENNREENIRMKTVGVIGGLGPMATVYFLELLTKMTKADCDQKHLRVFTVSIPDTPDRTAYIVGESQKNPLPFLVEAGKQLALAGADFIAIPCMTAQYFKQELELQVKIPVIDLCKELALYLKQAGVLHIGILATTGTLECQVIQKALETVNIHAIYPTKEQQKKIMAIIYDEIKMGRKPDLKSFCEIGAAIQKQGAEKIVLGCTELSLLKKDYCLAPYYIDILEILSMAVITKAGASVKKEYNEYEYSEYEHRRK